MGRQRKPGFEWLPERVYAGRSAYEFKPKCGGTIRLAPLSASKRAVLNRWEEEQRKLDMKSGSFQALVDEYLKSATFLKLAPSSQKKYLQNSNKVLAVFGRVPSNKIKPEHIRQYMDKRGEAHEVAANREKSFISTVFSWGYERGKVAINPAKGVKKFTEQARKRYITDEEYAQVYAHADQVTQAVMEISYCCAARVSDVLSLKPVQITDEGLLIKQGKTGKEQIKSWSPRLRAAIALSQSLQSTKSPVRIVSNENGQKLSYDALRVRWNNAKAAAKKANPELAVDFTFHDIKAKSISDYDGNKQRFSGHKSASQVAVYDRKTDIVDTH